MGVAYINNPQIMYIGMQAQYFSFMMFDIQSHFVKNIILHKTKLPSI
jgi:trimethylamine monooxygenase